MQQINWGCGLRLDADDEGLVGAICGQKIVCLDMEILARWIFLEWNYVWSCDV